MYIKGKVLLRLFRKNQVTVELVAQELGLSLSKFWDVLRGSVPLGLEESRLILAMFGAEDMATAVNWEALSERCPV